MAASVLADTGALLALLDADDSWHERCVAAFERLPLPLGTSAAVLTELFHLVGEHSRELRAAWSFVRSGALHVMEMGDRDLAILDALMAKYRDRPMNFADATLVHLAKRERVSAIFTVDVDDFETYRIDGRRRFRIVPGRP